VQIDWLTGSVATPPELSPGYDIGRYLRVGPGGVVQKAWAAKETVRDDEGSFSRNFTVWTPTEGELFISGNPVKLLQGHNAFGSCDALGLFLAAGVFVRQSAGWFPGPATWESCHFEGPRFTRIDLTRSYRFPSSRYALEWLRHVAAMSRDRRGGALTKGETVYFGKTSTRWTMKLYEKEGELLRRMMERFHGVPGAVREWAAGVVRFELTLRRPELEKWPALVSALRPGTGRAAALQLWTEYYDRIVWNGAMDMREPDLIEESLPSHLRLKLAAWRSGADLRSMLKKSQFYTVRRELLGAVGVDIAAPPPSAVDVLEPVTAGLDPAGWDPEPLAAHYVEPDERLAASYKLL
jgi:hypothetical protein